MYFKVLTSGNICLNCQETELVQNVSLVTLPKILVLEFDILNEAQENIGRTRSIQPTLDLFEFMDKDGD